MCREDVGIPLTKPAPFFPVSLPIETVLSNPIVDDAGKQNTQAFHVYRLQNPSIKACVNVNLSLLFDKRGGDSNDGYPPVKGTSFGEPPWVCFLEGADHLCGSQTIYNRHLCFR